jgi:hypothetical protein
VTALEVAPELLLWDARAPALRAPIEARFGAALEEAYWKLCEADADGLAQLSRDTPADTLVRVIAAPRSVRRLVWKRSGETTRSLRFLRQALLVEHALLNGGDGAEGWTADGRAHCGGAGNVLTQPLIAGDRIPLDLVSPHARSIDLMGGSRIIRQRSKPGSAVAEGTAIRLGEAWQAIASEGGTAGECVAAWTRVIVAQPDGSGQFWSGTNGEYVGRVVLVNVQDPRVTLEEIMDAVVHEAIHGLLYMHESVEPWVSDPALYTAEPAVTSPWSGSPLPLRPFMQACFVWYGLAMFWAPQIGNPRFDAERVHYLLRRAIGGFASDSLLDLLAPYEDAVRPDMLELIAELQRTVRSLMG